MSERIHEEIAESLREIESTLSSFLTVPQFPTLPPTLFRQILRFPTLSVNMSLPKSVTVDGGIKFNVNTIERDRFYEVEYEGTKYIIRLTKDGILENYEVE